MAPKVKQSFKDQGWIQCHICNRHFLGRDKLQQHECEFCGNEKEGADSSGFPHIKEKVLLTNSVVSNESKLSLLICFKMQIIN